MAHQSPSVMPPVPRHPPTPLPLQRPLVPYNPKPFTPFTPSTFTPAPFTPLSSTTPAYPSTPTATPSTPVATPFSRMSAQRHRSLPDPSLRTITRGERLAHALARGFVSAKFIASRNELDTFTEFLGPMAPERYKALPKHSHAAARALIGVIVNKGEKEVARLEAFRKSGTLRAHPVEQDDQGWFGTVVRCLNGDLPDVEQTRHWRCGHNSSEFSWRNAVLPLEAFNMKRVGGRDFSSRLAPCGKDVNLNIDREQLVREEKVERSQVVTEVLDEEVVALGAQTIPDVDIINMESRLNAESGGQAQRGAIMENVPSKNRVAVERNRERDSNRGEDIVATTQEQLLRDVVEKEVPLPELYDPPFPTMDVEIDDIDRPPLEATQSQAIISPMDIEDGAKVLPARHSESVREMPKHVPKQEQKRKWKLPVKIVHDDVTGNVSIDFDFVRVDNQKKIVWHLAPVEREVAEVCSDAEGTVVACKVRRDAPVGMLKEMLNDINNEESDPPAEVVVLEEGPAEIQPVANIVKKTRRQKATMLSLRKKKREQRKSKLRSAIQETMQDGAGVKKDVAERGVVLGANGSAKKRARVEEKPEPQRRFSRRVKKNNPIVDSPDSDDDDDEEHGQNGGDDDKDEDYHVEANGGFVAVPPRTEPRASSTTKRESVTPRGKGSSASPKGRESRRSRARARESITPDSPAVEPRQKRRRSGINDDQDDERQLWEQSIIEVEQMIEDGKTESPSESLDEAGAMKTTRRMPLARRLLKQVWEGKLCLLETDAFDEHADMAEYYESTKNEPDYGAGLPSPGTQYALENSVRTTSKDELETSPVEEQPLAGDGFIQAAGEAAAAAAAEVAALGEFGRIRTASEGSGGERSDYSSVRSDSSDEGEYGIAPNDRQLPGGSRARELQQRVCGEVIENMSADSKRKVLRWAEKDFSWFDNGAEFMEIVATRQRKECKECGRGGGGGGGRRCEETILLKLWTNLSWRKVRRMRHCGRGRKTVEGI